MQGYKLDVRILGKISASLPLISKPTQVMLDRAHRHHSKKAEPRIAHLNVGRRYKISNRAARLFAKA
jgi:hypothetical protein